MIERILISKADFFPLEEDNPSNTEPTMPQHENIRGGDYYQ
jgi:hypothetical protein